MDYNIDDGFNEFLQGVIDGDHLGGPALGITKKVIEEGTGNLSEKQRYVFETYVLGEFVTPKCARCGCEIP